jgi:hypothetical protein
LDWLLEGLVGLIAALLGRRKRVRLAFRVEGGGGSVASAQGPVFVWDVRNPGWRPSGVLCLGVELKDGRDVLVGCGSEDGGGSPVPQMLSRRQKAHFRCNVRDLRDDILRGYPGAGDVAIRPFVADGSGRRRYVRWWSFDLQTLEARPGSKKRT